MVRIGRGIARSVAAEIAQVHRAPILRGEVGLSRKLDLSFDAANARFDEWVKAK